VRVCVASHKSSFMNFRDLSCVCQLNEYRLVVFALMALERFPNVAWWHILIAAFSVGIPVTR
jgi:hypothetical protein